ncbi:cytochrome b/b6 domain-containing protein [Caenimonas sp. SL110]|uniref:cytochrome b/b6 domain-containing protein n=1 Tax=Caenimonas sp. SL110 TaxID=1450524 RepID=UPI0006548C59|nr:cytochrome b/b6 domain-containing protein [Caenimonas sp. SL110]
MTSSSTQAAGAAPRAAAATTTTATTAAPGRLVIDAPTRMFHWLFALGFLGAWVTADGERFRLLHVTLGYTMLGLLAFRVVYGLVGPRQARLSALLRKASGIGQWLRAAFTAGSPGAVNWRQGQNLLMGVAVVALLVIVLPLTLSGIGTYNEWLGGDAFEDVHEFFGNAMLAVVLAHLGLILALSILRRRNQAMPMITGRMPGNGPDLVQRKRTWLAALLLLAVLSYGAWEWQQSPNGLLAGSENSSHERGDD